MIQVQKLIRARRLKQRQAAQILRVSQPRVSDLLRGRIDLFSTDALIDMLVRLGARVRLTVKPSRRRLRVAEIILQALSVRSAKVLCPPSGALSESQAHPDGRRRAAGDARHHRCLGADLAAMARER